MTGQDPALRLLRQLREVHVRDLPGAATPNPEHGGQIINLAVTLRVVDLCQQRGIAIESEVLVVDDARDPFRLFPMAVVVQMLLLGKFAKVARQGEVIVFDLIEPQRRAPSAMRRAA